MATRICPDCGAQYVASVRRCIDCDVVLTDPAANASEAPASPPSGAPVGDGDRIGYELEGWGNQLKVTLEGMLDRADIRRVWEAGALVVSVADESTVDELIATLEGGDVDELLDSDEERVAFEIEGLDADGQAELDARLLADGVGHAWTDDGELLVTIEDEERVAAIIEGVLEGASDEVDGLAAQEALSDLFVAVDRLVKSPLDKKLTAAYRKAADGLDEVGVPYGFSAGDWQRLLDEIAELGQLAGPAPIDTEADERDADLVDEDATDASEGDDGDGDTDAPGEDGVGATEGDVDGESDVDAEGDVDVDGESSDDADDDDETGATTRSERAREAAVQLRERLRDFV